MVRAHLEAVGPVQAPGHAGQEPIRCLRHRSAILADQMLVEIVSQVVNGPSVAQMGMFDHAGALEGIEAAVDGGAMGLSSGQAHTVGQLLGGQVRTCGDELLYQRPSCRGDALATGPQQPDHLFDSRLGHRAQAMSTLKLGVLLNSTGLVGNQSRLTHEEACDEPCDECCKRSRGSGRP